MTKWMLVSVVLMFVLVLVVVSLISKLVYSQRELESFQNNILVTQESFEINLVEADLKTLGHLSPTVIREVISELGSAAKKYQVPVGLLHAVIRVESEYRFWIDHPPIVAKGVKTNAIGFGGVVWEYWNNFLIEQKIAEKKSDLYLPKINISATAAIIRDIIDKNPNFLHEGNLIQSLIKGYYGMYDNNYHDKMVKITSDLWLKRIVKEILVYKKEEENDARITF